jgi:hypothetical protein
LSGIVELEAGDAFAGRGEGGFGKLSELPAINKRFEDILLDIQVIVETAAILSRNAGRCSIALFTP